MIDQIIINGKSSFDDFGASVAKRAHAQPKKKSIKETVPFSNITHDFTAINGEIYWEERELGYVFEITAPTPELLEEMKKAFSNWLMNIIKEELHDPIAPDYHYIVTYEDMSFDDDEGMEKTTATVSFSAYPYQVSNYVITHEFEVSANSEKSAWIPNESSHRITPVISTDQSIVLSLDDISYSMGAGTAEDEAFKLGVGMNYVRISNPNEADCNVTISFREEVF